MLRKTLFGLGMVLALAGTVSAQESLNNLDADADAKQLQALQEQSAAIREQILSQGPYFAIRGTLQSLGGKSYSVNGEGFVVNEDTRINGQPSNGSEVAVNGIIRDGQRIAKVINVGKPQSADSKSLGGPDLEESKKLMLPGPLQKN